MPELPEVETIKRQLNSRLKGKKISRVDVFLPKFVKYPLEKFKEIVEGSKIKKVSRRAKLIIIELDSGYFLIIHLKLTGQLIYNGEKSKHTHLIYYFSDDGCLIHNDLRQFGFVKVIPKKEIDDFLAKEKLGPEPLEKSFTLKLFSELLKRRKGGKIKQVLMDQKFVSGIGNLYSDEILFFAGVLPTRKVSSLNKEEIKKIYQGIKKILPLAIKRRGSSPDSYLDAEGKKGSYLSLVKVYQREGKPCLKCGAKIQRLKMAGRSAHYCPECQK